MKRKFFKINQKSHNVTECLEIPEANVDFSTTSNIVFVDGKTPKVGDVIKVTDFDGDSYYTRCHVDFNRTLQTNVNWDDLLGKVIEAVSWLKSILLFIRGMLPPKED